MSERLEERLRRAARTYRKLGNHTAEGMFIEAADAITELRGALSVASVNYRHLSDENAKLLAMRDTWAENDAKLRELVRNMWHELDAATQYDAGGGRGVVYEFADRMRELGIGASADA